MLAPILFFSGVLSGLGFAAALMGRSQLAAGEFLLSALLLGVVAAVVVRRRQA